MNNLDHIDELFSDKLNQHEENVPPYIWDTIADKLDGKKRKRRLIYIQSAAASVAVLIAFFAGYYLTNSSNNNQLISENNPKVVLNQENNAAIEDGSAKTNEINSGISTTESKDLFEQKNIQKKADNDILNLKNVNTPKSSFTLLANNEEVSANEENEKEENFLQRLFNVDFAGFENENLATNIIYPDNITYAFVDMYGIEDEEIDKEKVNSWLIGGRLSPVYSYRNATNGSNTYTENANIVNGAGVGNSTEGGVLSYAGGVNIGYKISKRLDVYSGVYYSEVGQVSNDVYINEYQSSTTEPLEINTSMGNIRTEYSSYNLVNSVANEELLPMDNTGSDVYFRSNTINSKIYQYIEFVEVPVLLKYRLIDRKFGMNLLGGMSTSFVVGNESLLEYDNSKYDLGETESIQTVNYNSTLGLGFEYALSNNLSMNLEPTFKYALNSINKDQGVYPYSFAVFTGINYRF